MQVLFIFFQKGHQGNTLLHLAASRGHFDLVKWGFETCSFYKKNPSLTNDLGETPLHVAASKYIHGKFYYCLNILNEYISYNA